MSVSILLHEVSGSERLTAARIMVETAFAKHATDYYVLTFRRRKLKPDGLTMQDYGEQIGDRLDLSTRALAAKTQKSLFPGQLQSAGSGIACSDGDRIYLEIETHGSPAPLAQLTWQIDVQGVVT